MWLCFIRLIILFFLRAGLAWILEQQMIVKSESYYFYFQKNTCFIEELILRCIAAKPWKRSKQNTNKKEAKHDTNHWFFYTLHLNISNSHINSIRKLYLFVGNSFQKSSINHRYNKHNGVHINSFIKLLLA